ncbi:MAG: hypothetical protein KC502_08435 [Myxococcales bacterium]|nr:hypothetical protein [Myxococcales bacterium]
MSKPVFIIHHPDDDALAAELAGQLVQSGLQTSRAAQLGRTARGREVMAKHIEQAGACLVLWSDLSCEDERITGQASYAINHAIPSVAVAIGLPPKPAPLGLPAIEWSGDIEELRGEVLGLLEWEEDEREKSVVAVRADIERAVDDGTRMRMWVAVAAVVGLIAAGVGAWMTMGNRSAEPASPVAVAEEQAPKPTAAPAAAAAPAAEAEKVAQAAKAPDNGDNGDKAAAPAEPTEAAKPTTDAEGKAAPKPAAAPAGAPPAAAVAEQPATPPAAAAEAAAPTEAAKTAQADAPIDRAAVLKGVKLPEGKVVQVLRINGTDRALHVSKSAIRLYQLFGPGAPALHASDAVRSQRMSRQYEMAHVSADGNTLMTVDRIVKGGVLAAKARISVWRRNTTGYWTTWRVRWEKVPPASDLKMTLTLADDRAEALIRWSKTADRDAGIARWSIWVPLSAPPKAVAGKPAGTHAPKPVARQPAPNAPKAAVKKAEPVAAPVRAPTPAASPSTKGTTGKGRAGRKQDNGRLPGW